VKAPVKEKLSPTLKLKSYKAIEQDGLRELLAARVRQYANVSQAAAAFDVSRAYLTNVLSGERGISAYIAGQLGYTERTIYEPLAPKE
jgi:hypothetical protein